MASVTAPTRLDAPTATATSRGVGARTIHAEAVRWLPRSDHDAFEVAARASSWQGWLGIGTADATRLAEPGDHADGTLLVGRRPVAVRWTVTRRLRDIVTLEATREGRTVATLVMSFACWYDGCVAELRLTSALGSPRRLRRSLRRSLERLEATVEPPAAVTPSRLAVARAREVHR